MHKKVLVYLFILVTTGSFAQPQGAPGGGMPPRQAGPSIVGKISGVLLDSTTNSPLEFANISLKKAGVDKVINGTLTDASGKFKLSNIAAGAYDLQFSFIGFKPKTLKNIVLTPAKPDVDAGNLLLAPMSVQLGEVEVIGERSLIENRVDKIVYNAEKDVSVAGLTATEVLRKVPLLTVDINGNVSLRGSSNINILVNGKPSGMFANSVADALQMIPADQIKSVEVITSPGAKYDAEGSGGIINIITKKKNLEGINGSINGSLGNVLNNGSLNLSVAKGRLSLNGSASLRHSWPRDSKNEFYREDVVANDQLRTLSQGGITESARNGFFGQFGLNYDINAFNSLSSSINFRGFGFTRDGTIDATYIDPSISLNQVYSRFEDNDNLNTGYDWTNDYIKTFKQKGRELSLGFQMNGNVGNQDILFNQTANVPELILRENQFNTSDNLELGFQADYTHPFGEKVKLEIGAKSILRDIDSDYDYEAYDEAINKYVLDPSRSNSFDYKQDVYAGYTSFTFEIGKKYSLISGLRYEHTSIGGSYAQGANPFSFDYDNLLPSATFSRKLKGFSSIKISYSQRIQRPSLFFINPFTNNSDRRNVSYGNPFLDPEKTHQTELTYTGSVKGISINTSLFYRRTEDIIESILGINSEGVSITTYQNVGTNNSIGTNIFASATIKKIWTLRGGINLYTYNGSGVINGQDVSQTALLYNANLNSSVSLKKGIQIELFGFFNSPRQTLQGTNPSFWIYNMGIRKELWKKKGSLGLTFVEPFNKYKNFASELEGPTFYQSSDFRIPFRSIGMNFSYRFGKIDNRPQVRTRRQRNSDLKEGGDATNNF